ncbi:hypothetical protein [Bradyrhizobium sp. Gha]|uniref:hypothetical protein n=1 Tax=Bradyrhizobium sp. Gha TaxID=1855318 RepID=UPI0008EB55F5|nr:hypothetical protein [Bradyrhizobium sp. Gha]SFI40016.1 hypothetical protein SAMN05216525_10874 [Bradyrhizobium sp. Gha]
MSSDEKKTWLDDLSEARGISARLSASLPDSVDIAAIGVLSKAPFQLLSVREALIWRTEELGRNACDVLERKDFTVAAMLIRGIAESAAMVWYLLEILEQRANYTPGQLNDKLMRLFAGTKLWQDMPDPVNVLTLVERIDRKLPGFSAAYDVLSEYVHPNWRGVSGLYSKIDQPNFIVHFGRGLRDEEAASQLAHALVSGLMTFELGYNNISDLMPEWIDGLEKIWPDKDPGPKN